MKVVLGLGSNQGDRAAYLRRALALVSAQVRNLKISGIYESDALLPAGAPSSWDRPFLNLAASGETDLDPQALLTSLKRIERDLGRRERERWAPREIDIDILVADYPISSPTLVVPHPALLERPFALWPLAELEPEWSSAAEELRTKSGANLNRTRKAANQWLGPELVGIVNVTPDSFSDGGKFLDPAIAASQAQDLARDGASVIDLGAESTRPGAIPVSADEEWKRLEAVIEKLVRQGSQTNFKISVDTRHAATTLRALEAGVKWINDVTGLENAEMRRWIARSEADVVLMHSLGVPPDRTKTLPLDKDPVEMVLDWALRRINELEREGIERKRLILDPGIGFGKTAEQSFALVRGADRLVSGLAKWGVRVLYGHSRKSFLSLLTDKPAAERDPETLAVSLHLARAGVHYLRVHETRTHARMLKTQFLAAFPKEVPGARLNVL